jgi:hypothetical protein
MPIKLAPARDIQQIGYRWKDFSQRDDKLSKREIKILLEDIRTLWDSLIYLGESIHSKDIDSGKLSKVR